MNFKYFKNYRSNNLKKIIIFVMITFFAFSNITEVVSAAIPMPNNSPFYFTSVQINNGTIIDSNTSNQVETGGDFGITPVDENVPVESTFLLTNEYKVFLQAGCWEPDAGVLSTTKTNKDMVVIRKSDTGEEVSGIIVSNDSLVNRFNASDYTVKVSLTKALEYSTNYQLVVKKYFTKVNKLGVCQNGLRNDVIIPFKTVSTTKLPVPENFKLLDLRPNAVTLQWDSVSGATSYQISRSLTVDGPYTTIGSVLAADGTTFTDNKILGNHNYYYKISAIGSGFQGEDSEALYLKTLKGTDLDGNGVVDIKDIAQIAKYYDLKKEDTDWQEAFDLNDDGIIDIYDLVRVSKEIE